MKQNRIFAYILQKNNINPKNMFFDKKRQCYCVINGESWWRYYIKSNILGISTKEMLYRGYFYEKQILEKLFRLHFDKVNNTIKLVQLHK
ncbi:hypothetical protein [Helicobacter apodemus]|uniref:Uncharacterized protein n=1 Tax=Helicobacter apodemus TaxID=135569 RepID=A0A2U8FD44_9HELI|nr:hypothetical protein [Helicobacter apodemus]AWI34170.1 hypothetical protein CDV25_04870 [Helicobacter apodemus]